MADEINLPPPPVASAAIRSKVVVWLLLPMCGRVGVLTVLCSPVLGVISVVVFLLFFLFCYTPSSR